MNNLEAIAVLKTMNEWRRFKGDLKDTPIQPCPYEFGKAIDYAIDVLQDDNRYHLEEILKLFKNHFQEYTIKEMTEIIQNGAKNEHEYT